MSLANIPITLIVAATKANGIGKNGTLPWPMLKKEMAYFARVTKRVPLPSNTGSMQSDTLKQTLLEGQSRNVVIMGRKTWDSIPPRLRPLKDRTNIVISRQERNQLGTLPEDVILATDITAGLESLERAVKQGKAKPSGRAFVIGGAAIYKAALSLPQTKRILLTRINNGFDCDTDFPIDLDSSDKWHRQSTQTLSAFIGEEVTQGHQTEGQEDDAVTYEFQLYERA